VLCVSLLDIFFCKDDLKFVCAALGLRWLTFKKRGLIEHRRHVKLVEGFAATDTAKVNAERANLALRISRDRVRGLN
jgi:hypothetical protein